MTHSTAAVQQVIDIYKSAAETAEKRIEEVITELNKLAESMEHGSMRKQIVLTQVLTLVSAKVALSVREPVVL